MDCKVLMYGYEVFRGWMLEHTQLYVVNLITIQSIASTFMSNTGCYDNVYQVSGVIQQFITKCVVGGRVMTANNNNIMLTINLQTSMLVVYTQVLCILWKGF